MTAIRHPNPINQFYRLDKDTPTGPWVKTTRWNNIFKGHNWDSENCMAAEIAVLVDAHTNGGIHTGPAGIRNWQDDFSGGIGVDDGAVAAKRHFGLSIPYPSGYDRNDVRAAVKARRHVSMAVDYRFVPEQFQLQQPGNFDHAIGLDDWRASDGWFLRYDSLATRAEWVPPEAVFPAAEHLATRSGRSSSSLFIAVSNIRPILAAAYDVTIRPLAGQKYRTFTRYFVQNGQITALDEGVRTGGFTTLCTPPKSILSKSGKRFVNLVQITKPVSGSAYDRWWVDEDWSKPR